VTPQRNPSNRRRWLVATCTGGLVAALGGCGFRLRQAPVFAFRSVAATLTDGSGLQRELRQAMESAGLQLLEPASPNLPAASQPKPDVVLTVLTDQRERAVVGSTAAGQVREFQLRVRFKFRLATPSGKELIPDSEILLQRDISYSETIALSKADEEAELYRDMQTDVVQQTLRRLAAVKSL
jgi:LPS-assembly lipoprotein